VPLTSLRLSFIQKMIEKENDSGTEEPVIDRVYNSDTADLRKPSSQVLPIKSDVKQLPCEETVTDRVNNTDNEWKTVNDGKETSSLEEMPEASMNLLNTAEK
jgi:hypothetical protein